jgi:hypothetical protein
MNSAGIVEKVRRSGISLTLNPAGTGLRLSADGGLPDEIVELVKAAKPEIVAHLQAERRCVNYWIANQIIAWPPSHCLHCRKPIIVGQTWVAVSNGAAVARFHESCHPEWLARQEAAARKALGLP